MKLLARSLLAQHVALLSGIGSMVWCAHSTQAATIAVSNQPAPGTGTGVNFEAFGRSTINAGGQVAFEALLTGTGVNAGNEEGLWVSSGGILALLARSGSAAPGTAAGVRYAGEFFTNSFSSIPLNPSGVTSFTALLAGSGVVETTDTGLWVGSPGNVTLVVREGTAAPGTGAGVNYGDLSHNAVNAAGQIVFSASLDGASVTSANEEALFSGAPGSLALLARAGSQAPGTAAGVTFEDLSVASINSNGQSAFSSFLVGTGVTSANSKGIWIGSPGSLALLARSGDPAPGAGAGVTYRFVGRNFDDEAPTINAAGQSVFLAGLTGAGVTAANNLGIYIGTPGNVAKLVRTGDQAPGLVTGALFANLSATPPLNASGESAFLAVVAGTGVTTANDTGIWKGSPGSVRKIVLEGDAAPLAGSGVLFGGFSLEESPMPSINDLGQLVFRSTLTGTGITQANDGSLWFSDAVGVLTLIVREGSAFQVAPGDTRTISVLDFNDLSGALDGQGSAFNSAGELTFYASFTDGSEGIFTTAIPEPATTTLVAFAAAMLMGRRRATRALPLASA